MRQHTQATDSFRRTMGAVGAVFLPAAGIVIAVMVVAMFTGWTAPAVTVLTIAGLAAVGAFLVGAVVFLVDAFRFHP